MKTLIARLAEIQKSLNAPKGQENKFGGYMYRSCEDILTATKPLLGGLVLTVSDEITSVADRVYVKATATITDGENSISTTAYAREAVSRKGMDESQITGATSSYARKYALNGLLLIDDSKDADNMDNSDSARVTTLDENQLETVTSLIAEVKANKPKLLAAYSVKHLQDIPAIHYLKLVHQLESKRSAA